MENKFELINVEFKNNILNSDKTLNEEVASYLDFVKMVEDEGKSFRKKLEKVMLDNGLYSEKLGKYNISIAFPKPTESLDEDKLITNENEELLLPFIVMNSSFDLEKFKEENPEMYQKYIKVELSIDSEKLKKMRPDVFDKYKVITPTSKEPYIVIKESKK